MKKLLPLILGACLAIALGVASADAQIVAVDLGTLGGGTLSVAYAVSNRGQVVGIGLTADRRVRAFSWTPAGGMIDIGALNAGDDRVYAFAVNDEGQVVGRSCLVRECRAFLWTATGGMIALGAPVNNSTTAGAVNGRGQVIGASSNMGFFWSADTGIKWLGGPAASRPSAISESGQVVGASYSAVPQDRAFSWTLEGGMIILLDDKINRANDVNANGEIVGEYWTGSHLRACMWTTERGFEDLGTLWGGHESQALAINNRGQVIGTGRLPDYRSYGFLWTRDDGMSDLGTLGADTAPVALNEAGQVVGWSDIPGIGQHAFIWSSGSRMFDLGTLGGGTSWAEAVNDAGRVVGHSRTADGEDHAAMWVTVPTAFDDLFALIGGFDLPRGIATSLRMKLQNARDALNAANRGQRKSAVGKLNAALNEIEAQRGQHLTEDQANMLVSFIKGILAVL